MVKNGNLELGCKVKFSAIQRKVKESWTTKRVTCVLDSECIGVVVGIRYLPVGTISPDPEDGHEFTRTGTIKTYLVAYSMHNAPVYVKPEHVSVLDSE